MENILFTKKQADDFLKSNNCKTTDDIESALMANFGSILEKALENEMNDHLGYSKYNWKNKDEYNSRNGHTSKTVKSSFGETKIQVPRDVERSFNPQIVEKHQRRVSSKTDELILSLYAKGVSVPDISSLLEETYKIHLSTDVISNITDKILSVAEEWQVRPLDSLYPILYLDGIVYKVRENGKVIKKTVYVIFAITLEGKKDILGIWIGEHETSKFWMQVLSDLKERGVKDILIASVDGLNGFEEAIKAIFPKTEVQKCIVHQIRTSLKFVNYKDRKEFCADMKLIYTAPNEKEALKALSAFEVRWTNKYGYAVKSWKNNWDLLSTFFNFPQEIKKIIYTTNQIESFNRKLRKITKTKGSFPTDNSLLKILYLVIQDYNNKWTMPIKDWGQIINQLCIYFEDRIQKYI